MNPCVVCIIYDDFDSSALPLLKQSSYHEGTFSSAKNYVEFHAVYYRNNKANVYTINEHNTPTLWVICPTADSTTI
jgi:hypothetical protein